LGHVTFNPEAFAAESLYYATANGGFEEEEYHLDGTDFDQGEAVSFLVSAAQAIGITSGTVRVGDRRRQVRVAVNKSLAALIGLVTYRSIGDTYFYRLSLTAREVDDTSREESDPKLPFPRHFQLRLAA
jgi:hypothetical protein